MKWNAAYPHVCRKEGCADKGTNPIESAEKVRIIVVRAEETLKIMLFNPAALVDLVRRQHLGLRIWKQIDSQSKVPLKILSEQNGP